MSAPTNRLLRPEELDAALADLDGWEVADKHLYKRFRFASFPDAVGFMVRAAFVAERLNHHPNWSNVYNQVEVELWSHDLGGVSALCVDLARGMDSAAR